MEALTPEQLRKKSDLENSIGILNRQCSNCIEEKERTRLLALRDIKAKEYFQLTGEYYQEYSSSL